MCSLSNHYIAENSCFQDFHEDKNVFHMKYHKLFAIAILVTAYFVSAAPYATN